MGAIDDAVSNVLADFNGRAQAGLYPREYGWLFWRNCMTQLLETGPRVDSPDTNSIRLYADSMTELVLEKYVKKQKLFIGEFHAHPRNQGTWAGQLPSPQDIVNEGFSVGGSMWPLKKPIAGYDCFDISPEFQIIQSLFFGDLILIDRGSAWKPFATIQDQQDELDRILRAYTNWHQSADARLGEVGQVDHDQFYSTWSTEVATIGILLGQRFSITSRRNPN